MRLSTSWHQYLSHHLLLFCLSGCLSSGNPGFLDTLCTYQSCRCLRASAFCLSCLEGSPSGETHSLTLFRSLLQHYIPSEVLTDHTFKNCDQASAQAGTFSASLLHFAPADIIPTLPYSEEAEICLCS